MNVSPIIKNNNKSKQNEPVNLNTIERNQQITYSKSDIKFILK